MKAAIFDIDGTLIDSVDLHAQAWQEALAAFGHRVAFERVRKQIGKGGDQLMPVFLSPREIRAHGPQLEKFRGDLFKSKFLPHVRAFPQVRRLFQRLAADGWTVAVASSAKAEEVEVYTDIAGITDLLDTKASSDDAKRSKPHPDIFLATINRLGDVDPRDCIVIGDSPYDARAAGKAGVRSIGVLCGGFPIGSLRRAGFAEIYGGPGDLLKHYARSLFAKSPRG